MSNKRPPIPPSVAKEDGITHINIYSKGATELGRLLSNFTYTPFTHPKYGHFGSVEAFWYWNSTGQCHDELKPLSGFKAKEEGRKFSKVDNPLFMKEVQEAIACKIEQNQRVLDLFKASHLPFMHYYCVGQGLDKVPIPAVEGIWHEYFFGKLRDRLKGLINGKDLKVIIAGSRLITDYQLVCDAITQSGFNIGEVVCGLAKGVDELGKRWAEERHIDVKEFPANWDQHGKRAGFLRNMEMAKYADVLIAVIQDESPGTSNMIDVMKKLGKPMYVLRTNTGVSDAA